MPGRADRQNENLLSEVRLCELVGVLRPTRRAWARKGFLRTQRAYGELDAVELATFARLSQCLGAADTAIAWSQVRPSLRQRLPSATLEIVFDLQFKKASLVNTDAELGVAVRHGRPTRVIPLGEHLADVREAFRRAWAQSSADRSPSRTRNRSDEERARSDLH